MSAPQIVRTARVSGATHQPGVPGGMVSAGQRPKMLDSDCETLCPKPPAQHKLRKLESNSSAAGKTIVTSHELSIMLLQGGISTLKL